jgi:uncharacterized membrane protein YuzA (DUF378 family)
MILCLYYTKKLSLVREFWDSPLVGLFNFDLVATLFGEMSILSRVIYVVVGISAIYVLMMAMGKNCDKKETPKE